MTFTTRGGVVISSSMIWLASILAAVFIFVSGFIYADVRNNRDNIDKIRIDLYSNYVSNKDYQRDMDQINGKLDYLIKMNLNLKTN
jgi:hypothetical protein